MAGIKNITELFNKHGEAGLRQILSQDIYITEKNDAYRFSIEKNPQTNELHYYGKNGKTPINKIDRCLNNVYEDAINYFESLSYDIRKSLPARHRFGFSWFPVLENGSSAKRPKNGLVLTDITIRDKKNESVSEIHDDVVCKRYSNVLNVNYAGAIFSGKLNETSINVLVEIAKKSIKPDALLENINEFKADSNKSQIESLIFKSNDNTLFKISNKEDAVKSEKRSHMLDLLLMDILEHAEQINISTIPVYSKRADEAYIDAVCEIFNSYVAYRGKDYLDTEMKKPVFLAKSGNFNPLLVKNAKTQLILENNSSYEYLLSIMLANLRKPKFPSGLLTESVANRFNAVIKNLDKITDDSYSFLEFSTIIKENNEDAEPPKKNEPDYEKSVHLLTRFFDNERQVSAGATPANIFILNCSFLSNRVLEEIESHVANNKHKCIIVHSQFLAKQKFGMSEENVEKALARLIQERKDLFLDYIMMDHVILSALINKLRPKFEPVNIYAYFDAASLQKEAEGLNYVYLDPNTKFKKISRLKDSSHQAIMQSLEDNVYLDFCKLTPTCLHPFYMDLKKYFDMYTYVS